MSGVIGVMRRTLLSCTSLVPGGIAGAGAVSLIDISPAWAAEPALAKRLLQTFMNLSQQDLTALAMALGVLSFSVVAAILKSAPYSHGTRGNFEKSGGRFSMKACFPSRPSSLM